MVENTHGRFGKGGHKSEQETNRDDDPFVGQCGKFVPHGLAEGQKTYMYTVQKKYQSEKGEYYALENIGDFLSG